MKIIMIFLDVTMEIISNLRMYIASENPYTFHKFPDGWDPEISTSGQFYPILRNFTFGLNLKF